MGRFFNSRFFDALTKASDVFLIGFYFIICSLPVITIGATTTALYYAIHKCVFKGKGYTLDFFKSFKDNFKQSTLSWLIFIVLFAVLGGDIYITRNMVSMDNPLSAGAIFFAILLAFTIVWAIFHFAYIARFANGFGASFKVSAIFMIANIGWSLLIMVIIAFASILVYSYMFLYVFMPGILACVLHPILERVFRKYMSPEDLAAELEDDQQP